MTTKVRHKVAPMPLGCRWCGVEERDHARRYVPGHSWHSWAHPTGPQISARLRSLIGRRSPRLLEVHA